MNDATPEYARSARVEVSRVGERVVLYHRDNGKALVLNPTGTWLWEQLVTSHTRDQLVAALRERHAELSAQQALQDTEAFLRELHEHHAIT